LNAQERPAQSAERPDLLLLCVVQDVAHPVRDYGVPALVNVSIRVS
jgi:hypothetical protein